MIAIRNREAIFERNRAIIAKNIELVQKFIEAHSAAFGWAPPRAGPISFPKLLKAPPGGVLQWAREVVEQAGVMLLPETVYRPDGAAVSNHFRLGLGRSNLETCLAKLGEYLDSKPA